MASDILSLFPPNIHPLTLVSDPDRLLAGETVMLELARRGFQVIQENDPVLLRHCVEEACPFSTQHPVIIITTAPLEELPYDLYQPAYRLMLSLHQYFPNLAYPVLQTLSPEQVEKLGSCTPSNETLGRQKTIDYLLQAVFNADPSRLSQPHAFIGWLNDYHQSGSPLPDLLRAGLVERLKRYPIYQDWEMDALIRETQAFSDFAQQQWQSSLEQTISGKKIQEVRQGYHLAFNHDAQLQDLLPALVRQGILQPVEIADKADLPAWSLPGVTLNDVRLHRFTLLLEGIENRLKAMEADPLAPTAWNTWSDLAQDWSELCSLNDQTDLAVGQAQKEGFQNLARELDKFFPAWLQNNYTQFGAQRLPRPHHVYHVPHYLAHLRNLGQVERVVLLILDGLSLADWQVIKPAWAKRHLNWEMKTETLLAQVPTVTSISRYALISGLRPADFANDLDHIAPAAKTWELFWSREGITETACKLLPLSIDRGFDQLPELQDPRVSFWCLIEDTPDKLAHHATLGTVDQQSSLRLWLDPAHDTNSTPIENLIDDYLNRSYSVFIASDHGHVGATGFGQPNEGLLAQTRGKRVRLYTDRLAALRVQDAFANTILWENDGILPDQMAALMPAGRAAFATNGEIVVTHGGISIDEVIVPLIQITKASA
jgi:hypothetical protein